MEIISNLINGVNNNETGVSRIKYNYNLKIAKHVWHGIAMKFIEDIQLDRDNRNAWTELIKYAFADESCEYDLNNAIGIIGQTGTGKTKTMQILKEFIAIDDIRYLLNGKMGRFSFKTVSAKLITGEYSTKGYTAIDKYCNMGCLCIDDLGSENLSTKHYGTEINVIEEIIENRYIKGMITHFTSNIKP
ncbi:unnamed protein product, partial [marine sediment metagenome]